ncbi:Uncharacterised protein [Mycobacteroides abscessus subsp. abscessus]|nr:Uncharacterised protein [Mycobacteroides abscessus subsp. abscessus]
MGPVKADLLFVYAFPVHDAIDIRTQQLSRFTFWHFRRDRNTNAGQCRGIRHTAVLQRLLRGGEAEPGALLHRRTEIGKQRGKRLIVYRCRVADGKVRNIGRRPCLYCRASVDQSVPHGLPVHAKATDHAKARHQYTIAVSGLVHIAHRATFSTTTAQTCPWTPQLSTTTA